jgi:predicted Zn-dependent protease
VGRTQPFSDRTLDDVSPATSAPADTPTCTAERRESTPSPPRLTTLQNAVLTAGVVFMIAVWIAAGWAFVDSFRNPPPLRPPPAVAEKSPPAVAEKTPPAVAEKTPPAVAEKSPPAVPEKSEALTDRPSRGAQPTSPVAVATDNSPKPAEAQTPAQSQSPPASLAVSSPVAGSGPPESAASGDLQQADQSPPSAEDDEQVDPVAREAMRRGWALYHLPYTPARWQQARQEFEQAFEIDPRSAEVRIGLASILSTRLADGWSPVLQEDMPQAEHLLLEAVDSGGVSNRAAAHFTLGVLRQMQNRLAEAQSEFETALSLDPSNVRANLHLGETLLYLGQPEAAIPPLEQATRLQPDNPNFAITHWTLGTCQLLAGRLDQAIDLLQKARAANPGWWVPYFYLAGAHGLQGDLKAARSMLAESIRLKPAIKSLARMRAENLWLSNPEYWALQEKTLNIGLRRAGLPDQWSAEVSR